MKKENLRELESERDAPRPFRVKNARGEYPEKKKKKRKRKRKRKRKIVSGNHTRAALPTLSLEKSHSASLTE